jgi:PAS domain S-box-containing protein
MDKTKEQLINELHELQNCITEREAPEDTHREIEESLKESEERFRAIAEHTYDGVILTDTNGTIIYWNPSATRIFGYEKNELLGKSGHVLMPNDAYPVQENAKQEFLSRGFAEVMDHPIETVALRKDGSRVNVEIFISSWEKNGEYFFCGIFRDITEQKTWELKLRESEEFLRKVISADPNLIFVKHRSGKYIEISSSLAKVFSSTADAVVGKTDLELAEMAKMSKQEAKKYRLDDLDVINTGKHKFIAEESITLPDGTVKWYQTTKVPLVRNNVSDYVLGVSVDITELKQTIDLLKKRELELKVKNQNLEELNTALKVLVQKKDENQLELEEKLLANMKILVEPYLEKLAYLCPDDRQQNFINIITANLKEVISPFSWKLSSGYVNLTPAETQVSDLIKNGHSNKEIADLLNISSETVAAHRKHIRKKLGIRNTKTNLRSYLKTLS